MRHVLESHEKDLPLKCPHCPKCFAYEYTRRVHVKEAHGPKIKCELCSQLLSSPRSMKKHMKRHMRTKNFQCDLCPRQFQSKDKIMRHMLWHRSKIIEESKCEECNAIFSCQFDLKSHRRFHLDPKPFKCDLCPGVYVSKYRVKNHIRFKHLRSATISVQSVRNSSIRGSVLGSTTKKFTEQRSV